MDILLKSAKIVDASQSDLHLKTKDVLITKGRISEIASNITPSGSVKTIRQEHLHISVGWIDTGVSFGEPGYEERETIPHGLGVAAKSGFTDIVLNPTGHPIPDGHGAIAFLKQRSLGQLTELHPLGALSVQSKGASLAELYDMQQAGAIGFYDYKRSLTNANLLKIALQYVQNFGGIVFSYPLDGSIAGKGIVNEGETSTALGLKGIPAMAESLVVARDLAILEYTGGRLHIPTISTKESVRLIAAAKAKGLSVSCSVAAHQLALTDAVLTDFDTRYKVLPPLRTTEHSDALIAGLQDGTIDHVSADHQPLNLELKHVEFDNAAYGTIGLETTFGILNPILGLETSIKALTQGRESLALPEAKIAVGEKACLTLFDPEVSFTFEKHHILSSSKNSIFLNRTLKGKVIGAINGDKTIIND